MRGRPAAGGGRWIEVGPERLARWLGGFAERHGEVAVERIAEGLRLTGADEATAECHLPYGWPPDVPSTAVVEDLVYAAGRPHRLGLLLARRGAFAVGLQRGDALVASKVDRSYVQGRTAAGGWSQQRFARRRDNQAKKAAGDAADVVARLLLPQAAELDAVVTGGDRQMVDAVLADRRLAPIAAKRAELFLDVPEPRLEVLREAAERARAVRILLREPG